MAEDPYALWLQVGPGERPPDHYALLKLPAFCDDRPQIEAAARSQLARLDRYAIHPDPQKRATCNRLMNEVAKARVVLASPERKSAYDRQLAGRLGLPPPAALGVPQEAPSATEEDSGADLAAEEYLAEIASAAQAVRGSAVRAKKQNLSRRNPWMPIAAAGGSFLIVLLIGCWLLLRSPEKPPPVSVIPTPSIHSDDSASPAVAPPKMQRHPSPTSTETVPNIGVKGKLFGDAGPTGPERTQGTPIHQDAPGIGPTRTQGVIPDAVSPPVEPNPISIRPPSGIAPPPMRIVRPPQRLSVPGAGDLASAQSVIGELFKTELAQHSSGDQDALAQKMLGQTLQTRDQPAVRYMLLHEACGLSAKVGDVALALQAAWQMRDLFAVDGKSLTSQILTEASHGSRSTPEAARRSVEAEISLAGLCLGDGEYEQASRAAALAAATVANASDPALTWRIKSLAPMIESVEMKYREVEPSLQTLATNRDDPGANLSAGKFYCFTLDQWQRGLPLLANGSDPLLKTLAARELHPPTAARGKAALGDAWLAASKTGQAHESMARRAGFWYQQAIPDLAGLTRLVMEKRLTAARASHLEPGLVAEFFNGRSFQRRLLTRIDPHIDFNWHGLPPTDGVPAEWFSARWSGWIKPVVAGSYRLTIIHDDGIRLSVDGKLVMDLWDHVGTNETTIGLTAEPHAIKLDYQQLTGDSYVAMRWVLPGGKRATADPALLHEPLTLSEQLPNQVAEDSDGTIHLTAPFADVHGTALQIVDPVNEGARVGRWTSQSDWASWTFAAGGSYQLSIARSCTDTDAGGTYRVSIGGSEFEDVVPATGGFAHPQTKDLGLVNLSPGPHLLSVQAVDKPHNLLMDITELTLTPVK